MRYSTHRKLTMFLLDRPWGFLFGFFIVVTEIFSSQPVSAQEIDNPFGDTAVSPKADESTPSVQAVSGKRIELMDDYQEALKTGRMEQRPVVVLLGAIWCGWCRKLESEIDSEGDSILKKWVVVKVDVDQDPEIAELLEASALPALRIIGLDEKVVAAKEGYLPVSQLDAWLDSNMNDANPKIQRVLYDQGNPNAEDTQELIRFLAHRSPNIRSAATERLVRSKTEVAGAVVETFKTGKLIQKLSALQVLQSWKAPVRNNDPWSPESMTDDAILPLMKWLDELNQGTGETKDGETDPGTAVEGDDAARAQSNSLLKKLLDSKTESAMSQAVSNRESMLPLVRERLAHSADFDDQQHGLLRELLYRMLAGEKTRLEQTSLLTAVASLNGDTHRAAAEKLLKSLTAKDQSLLDELSADSDAIVREMTIPLQQSLKGLESPDRLKRLLGDKSPSVRTAILRELSESKSSKSIDTLIEYIQGETEEDLLVYATKTLGKLGTKKGAQETLTMLTQNGSWRVRAAAIDAIGEAIESANRHAYGDDRKVSKEAAEAVITGLNDADPFVVSRADTLVVKTISRQTAPTIAKYWMTHPEKIAPMLKEVSEYEKPKLFTPIVEAAQELLKSADADEIRKAATLITKLSPTSLNDNIVSLLASENGETRIAAMEALIATLVAPRLGKSDRSYTSFSMDSDIQIKKTDPTRLWYPVPESLQTLPKSKSKRLRSESEVTQTPYSPSRSLLGSVLGSFFGGTPSNPPGVMEGPAEVVDIDSPITESLADDGPILSEEEAAKKEAELAVVDDFFGSAPSVEPFLESNLSAISEDVSDAAALSVEKEANWEVAEGDPFFQPGEKRESPPSKDLPSKWLQVWQSDKPKKQADAWVGAISAEFQSSIQKGASNELNERELKWLQAASLATGDVSQSKVVADSISSSASQSDSKIELPTREMMLPWLAKEDRIRLIREAKLDWKNLSKADLDFLKSATVVDDLDVASWILTNALESGLEPKQLSQLQPCFLRALVGPAADSINTWVYAPQSGMSYSSGEKVPGTDRAIRWLHEQYLANQSDAIRSFLFASLSYMDHDLAVQSAVGFVAQATEPSDCLNVALRLSLVDENTMSADRAVQWLPHPVSLVREKSIKFLCSNTTKLGQSERSKYGLVTVYNQDEHLPGLWYVQRDLPFDAIQSIVDSKAEGAESASILMLASPAKPSVKEVAEKHTDMESRILICVALAIAERTDPEAFNFYNLVSQSLQKEDENASPLYAILRDLKGPEIRTLRTELRQKHGASILRP